MGQDRGVDVVLGETLRILGHAELSEPIRNLSHCGVLPRAPCVAPVELSEPKGLGHFGLKRFATGDCPLARKVSLSVAIPRPSARRPARGCYQIPTQSFDLVQGTFNPQVLTWSGSMQYRMPYLKSEIQDLQLPDFLNHLIPIVEFQMSTPVANNFGNSFLTTGTINPGVIWVGSYFQVGLEAQLPVNGVSGHGVGVLGQLHLYLDDIFPTTVGQPLLGGRSTAPRRLTF
jgi:hypothetical protein